MEQTFYRQWEVQLILSEGQREMTDIKKIKMLNTIVEMSPEDAKGSNSASIKRFDERLRTTMFFPEETYSPTK